MAARLLAAIAMFSACASSRSASLLLRGPMLPYASRTLAVRASAAAPDASPPLTPLPDGMLVVHKPQNWTSSDVVGKVRNTLERHYKGLGHKFRGRRRLKVGHGGTLDPMATGMLVLGVGTGCRRLQQYLQGAKAYAARAQLGFETDTQDAEGTATTTAAFDHVARADLERAAAGLTGTIEQRPPIYSALRKDGKRLYELARAGEIQAEEVETRSVTVYKLDVCDFDAASGTFSLDVSCGGGTYIRSLIESIGRDVGSAAHMIELERTRHGPFCAEEEAARAAAEEGEALAGVTPVTLEQFGDVERILGAIDEAGAALTALGETG